MNVVFLSPNFPHQFYLFCTALQRRGATVLGIGDSPPPDLRTELKASLSEYVYLPKLDNYGDLSRAVGYLIWRHGRIDRIDSHNEHWLGLEAQLREDFNIPGQRPEKASRHRSKAGMGEVFREAKVPYPELVPYTTDAALRAFAERVGFPLVLKPEIGVGAGETFKVGSWEELEAALRRGLSGYVAQRFVTGTVTSFDGLADRDGRILFWTSHVYSSGVMEIVNEQRDVSFWSRREIPKALEDFGRRTVKAFDIRERFFHAEFFELADGSFVALEVNLRPPGGFTLDMMNYACDLDLYDLWARVLTGDDLSNFRFERRYHAAHVARRRQYQYRVPHEELVRKMGPALMTYRELPPAIATAMGDYVYIVRHEDRAALEELIRLAQERA